MISKNIIAISAICLSLATAMAADKYWTGGGSDNDYSTAANWNANPDNGDPTWVQNGKRGTQDFIVLFSSKVSLDKPAWVCNGDKAVIFTAKDDSCGLLIGKESGSTRELRIGADKNDCSNGHLIIRNGVYSVPKATILGHASGTTGTLTLEGGVYSSPSIKPDAGTGIVNFNGGVLSAPAAANGIFGDANANITLNVLAGGAIISNDYSMVINNSFATAAENTGGLTKMGMGMLELKSPTYIGKTIIESGALVVPESCTLSDIEIKKGGILLVRSSNPSTTTDIPSTFEHGTITVPDGEDMSNYVRAYTGARITASGTTTTSVWVGSSGDRFNNASSWSDGEPGAIDTAEFRCDAFVYGNSNDHEEISSLVVKNGAKVVFRSSNENNYPRVATDDITGNGEITLYRFGLEPKTSTAKLVIPETVDLVIKNDQDGKDSWLDGLDGGSITVKGKTTVYKRLHILRNVVFEGEMDLKSTALVVRPNTNSGDVTFGRISGEAGAEMTLDRNCKTTFTGSVLGAFTLTHSDGTMLFQPAEGETIEIQPTISTTSSQSNPITFAGSGTTRLISEFASPAVINGTVAFAADTTISKPSSYTADTPSMISGSGTIVVESGITLKIMTLNYFGNYNSSEKFDGTGGFSDGCIVVQGHLYLDPELSAQSGDHPDATILGGAKLVMKGGTIDRFGGSNGTNNSKLGAIEVFSGTSNTINNYYSRGNDPKQGCNVTVDGSLTGRGDLTVDTQARTITFNGSGDKFSGNLTMAGAGSIKFVRADFGSPDAVYVSKANTDTYGKLYLDHAAGTTMQLGAFTQESAARPIYLTNAAKLEIGSKADSVIAGTQEGEQIEIIKVGANTKLTFSATAQFVNGSTITVKGGVLENNATLSNVSAEVWDGAVITGSGSFSAITCKSADGQTQYGTATKGDSGWTIAAQNEADAQKVAAMIPVKDLRTQAQIDDGVELSYYKNATVTSSGTDTYTIESAEFADDILVDIGKDTEVTVSSTEIAFSSPTNLKKGLYYGVGVKDSVGGAFSLPDGKTYTQYNGSNGESMNLTAALPESGVMYYTIMVSDTGDVSEVGSGE